jgi:hypothetical protein
MNAEQITMELIKRNDSPNAWQGVRHLMLKLKKEDSSLVLDGLLGVFFLDEGYDRQLAAGGLLWKLKPKYDRDLREDIRRSLQTWNVSTEELPWYLAESVGIDVVRKEVESILAEPLEDKERRVAETYLYWLSVSDAEDFRNQLDRQWNQLLGD